MTATDTPSKKAYFSTNNLDDTVCLLALLQRIQSWQLYQSVLPRLEDDVECTTAALSKRVGLSLLASSIRAPLPPTHAGIAIDHSGANRTLDPRPPAAARN